MCIVEFLWTEGSDARQTFHGLEDPRPAIGA